MPQTSLPHRDLAAVHSAPRLATRFRRTGRIVAGLSALALVLAACGSESASAVTVNSKSVDESTVNEELAAIAKNPELKDRVLEKGKVNPSVEAAWLSMIVETQVAEQALEEAGTEIAKGDRTAARRWADGYFGSAPAFAAFPKSFREAIVERYASVPAYVRTHTAPPTDALVRAAYDSSLTQNCKSKRYVSHILVADETTAQTVVTELAAGADFAKVAKQRSTDSQSATRGGALGCIDGQQIDPTFAAAAGATPVGQVSAPVKTEFGWHVIKVEDVAQALPFEKVQAEIRADLIEQGPEGTKKLQKLMGRAKVKVASRYGRWVVKDGQGSVQPLTATTTSNPASSSSSTTTTTGP